MVKRWKQEEEQVIIIIYDDLIIDILSRLPVKSLLRFRSVSKKWKDIISSHSFRNIHRQRQTCSLPLLVGFHPRNRVTTYDLYGRMVREFTLPISLNYYFSMMNVPYQSKLVCFENHTSGNRYFLYNPSSQQFAQLPTESLQDLDIYGSTLGYIQSRDEYMLVHMIRRNSKDAWVCQILTLSISDGNFQLPEWRSLEESIPTHHFSDPGVFVCGAFYWIASDNNNNIQELCVFSLDIKTEVFSTFGLPQTIRYSWDGVLMELKDELFYLDETITLLTTINLWKFIDENKSWTLYKSINIESLGLDNSTRSLTNQMRLFITRLEYLQYYKKPYKISGEMGMLKINEGEQGEEEGAVLIDAEHGGYQIHTNLLTL